MVTSVFICFLGIKKNHLKGQMILSSNRFVRLFSCSHLLLAVPYCLWKRALLKKIVRTDFLNVSVVICLHSFFGEINVFIKVILLLFNAGSSILSKADGLFYRQSNDGATGLLPEQFIFQLAAGN